LNLRIYENDIPSIKALALEKGLPYQTLLAFYYPSGGHKTNKNLATLSGLKTSLLPTSDNLLFKI